jgi:hypothetical protein
MNSRHNPALGMKHELLVVTVSAGRGSAGGETSAYKAGYGAFAFSVCGRQDLKTLRAGRNQL